MLFAIWLGTRTPIELVFPSREGISNSIYGETLTKFFFEDSAILFLNIL